MAEDRFLAAADWRSFALAFLSPIPDCGFPLGLAVGFSSTHVSHDRINGIKLCLELCPVDGQRQ